MSTSARREPVFRSLRAATLAALVALSPAPAMAQPSAQLGAGRVDAREADAEWGAYGSLDYSGLAYAGPAFDVGGLLRLSFGARYRASFIGLSAAGSVIGNSGEVDRARPNFGFQTCVDAGRRAPWTPMVFVVGARGCFLATQIYPAGAVPRSQLAYGASAGVWLMVGGPIAALPEGVLDVAVRIEGALAALDFPGRELAVHVSVGPVLLLRR